MNDSSDLASLPTRGELAKMRLTELRKLATQNGLSGISQLRKPALVEALSALAAQKKAAATPPPTVQQLSDAPPPPPIEPEVIIPLKSTEPAIQDSPNKPPIRPSRRASVAAADAAAIAAALPSAEPKTPVLRRSAAQHAAQAELGLELDKLIPQPEKDQEAEPRNTRKRDRRTPRTQNEPKSPTSEPQEISEATSDEQVENDPKLRSAQGRNRLRGRRNSSEDFEPEITDDDVLIPIAGILNILDNYAFVRTTGYLPGPADVYVSLGQVKKYQLREGDAIVGAVRQPREGAAPPRQKYNALVKIDSINGQTPQEATSRTEFGSLTPIYPNERFRLETTPEVTTTRVIDLISPIGKGQRGLILAPNKAGKTFVLRAIAAAIAANNPETHIMMVLVGERPEEVTAMSRTIKGEVIASTFDRTAEDHTTIAQLAIERAKRLVELGNDVVVLLDSLTEIARAYNVAAPTTGRILPSGIDPLALHPAKRFFGAGRNIEGGGSLTVLATALVETGSQIDEAIVEEFTGGENMVLKLSGVLAAGRIFPAINLAASGTMHENELRTNREVQIIERWRKAIAGLEMQQQLHIVLNKLTGSTANAHLLEELDQSLPGGTR